MKLKNIDCDFDAVIFDFDGTLVDSMWMWRDIDIEYLARFGIAFRDRIQLDIEGMNMRDAAIYFRDVLGVPRSIEEMRDDWLEMSNDKYAHEVRPKPHVIDFLDFLKFNNIKMGVASSSDSENVAVCVESNELTKYMDVIMTTGEVGRGKPYPDIFLTVARRLGTDPARCLAFEDVPAGINSARAAGMKVVAVYDEFSADQTEEKIRLADYYINDFSELLS